MIENIYKQDMKTKVSEHNCIHVCPSHLVTANNQIVRVKFKGIVLRLNCYLRQTNALVLTRIICIIMNCDKIMIIIIGEKDENQKPGKH